MDDSVPLWRRATTEAIGTFMLVFAGCGAAVTDAHTDGALGAVGVALVFAVVITAVATDTRAVGAAAAIATGLTVGLDALFGGPLTGASMTPARSFGPAPASGTWIDFWIYLAGPFAAAALGAFAYELIRGSRPAVPPPTTPEERHGNRPVRLPA